MFISYLLIFLLGISIGSFLNVLIYRFPKRENFLISRSFCPKCHHKLNWSDLIPLFSFFLLRGKCRYCKKSISFHYPLIEFLTGILLCLIFYRLEINFLFFIYFSIISILLILIFFYDLKYYIIPNIAVYSLIVFTLIFNVFSKIFPEILILAPEYSTLNTIYTALGASFCFFLIFLISQGKWLGFGDVKLIFFMGLFLGFPKILIAIFLASLIGSIIGLGLIALGKKGFKSEIPFGPFLIMGTYFALFWGQNFINWYLPLINL